MNKEFIKIYKELLELREASFFKEVEIIREYQGAKVITWLCNADTQVKWRKTIKEG